MPEEARRLPPDELVADLIVGGDPARVLTARLASAARLLPVSEQLGFFGAHARAVACFIRAPSAKNFLLARQSVRGGDATSGGAAPRLRDERDEAPQ